MVGADAILSAFRDWNPQLYTTTPEDAWIAACAWAATQSATPATSEANQVKDILAIVQRAFDSCDPKMCNCDEIGVEEGLANLIQTLAVSGYPTESQP